MVQRGHHDLVSLKFRAPDLSLSHSSTDGYHEHASSTERTNKPITSGGEAAAEPSTKGYQLEAP